MYPPAVDRQQLGKEFNATTNTHATIKNCWASFFLCGPYRIKGKQAISFFPELIV
jgi:hypothetical protein